MYIHVHYMVVLLEEISYDLMIKDTSSSVVGVQSIWLVLK